MEIINEAQVEKHRLQSLVKLVDELGPLDQNTLLQLLQPLEQDFASPEASPRKNLDGAKELGLVKEDGKQVVSQLSHERFEPMSAFHDYLVHTMLGVTSSEQSSYRFNLFSAWYAVQDERVLFAANYKDGYDATFNQQLFPSERGRFFNSTKLSAWRKWAAFLGLGWIMKFGGREVLVPDATKRLQPMLAEIFEEQRSLTCTQFMERLAILCPELDGGVLFERCWSASRGGEERGHQLSLMLSTALRTLEKLGQLRLLEQADALENWQLYPAEGDNRRVTHIEYNRK